MISAHKSQDILGQVRGETVALSEKRIANPGVPGAHDFFEHDKFRSGHGHKLANCGADMPPGGTGC